MIRRKTKAKRSKQRHNRSSSNFSNAIRKLKKLKANDQREAIKMANDTFIRQFCQEIKLLKRAKLSPKKRKALKKHKKQLQRLVNARTSASKQRHILTQKGGGILKSILSSIPIVGSVIDLIHNL